MQKLDSSVLFYMRGDSYYDISPNSVASVSVNGYPSVVTDKGPALYFNGTSNSITVTGLNFNSILSNDYTIEFEAMQVSRIQSYPTPFSIVYGDGAYETQRSLYSHWKADTVLSFYDSRNIEYQYTNGALNRWIHVARVRQGNTLKTYVDGTLLYTVTDASTLYTNANRLYLAGLSNSITGTLFNGYVRNVMISNKVKYTSEFTPTYEQSTSVSIDNVRIEENKVLFEVNKLSQRETIQGIDVILNGKVVQSYTSVGTYECQLDGINNIGSHNIEIKVRLNGVATISETLTHVVKVDIQKIESNSSFEEINEKLVELKNVYTTLSDRLFYILTSKNITIADDERKLSSLIEKVNELD